MATCKIWLRARKQTIIVDFFFFVHSSDNVYNVFIVEYCDPLITSIMFLSLRIAIIYIITTFHKL